MRTPVSLRLWSSSWRFVWLLVLTLAALGESATPAEAAHTFTLSPGLGPVGTLVTVTPSGFTGAQPYKVYWDWADVTNIGSEVGGGSGATPTTFNVPVSAVPGDHLVNVCLNCNGSSPHWAVPKRFRVTEPTPIPTPVPSPSPTRPPPTPTPRPTAPPTHAPTDTPTPPPVATVPPTPIGGIIGKTPTPKPPDLAAPGEVVDLRVWGMEVTQGIQNLQNDMPLVAGRQTVVRVYARTDGKDTLNIVKGALGAWRDGNFLGVISPDNAPISAHEDGGDRVNVNDSLYFYLPPAWRSGTVLLKTFVYQGDVDAPFDHEPNANNNFSEVEVTFNEAKSAHVMLVPIHLHEMPDSTTPEHTYTWPENFGETIQIMLDVYRLNPVAKVYVYGGGPENTVYPFLHEVPLEQEGPTGPREWNLADPLQVQLPNQAIDTIADNTDPWVEDLRWYGMIENDVTMKMQKEGFDPISLSGIAGYGRSYGKMSSDYDADSPWHISRGATIAHELGHNYGLNHVNCKGTEEAGGGIDPLYPFPTPNCKIALTDETGFMGFDVYYQSWSYLTEPTVISNDPGIATPNQGWPFMGYNSPKWIDPYAYCKMLFGYGVPCDINLTPQIYAPERDALVYAGDPRQAGLDANVASAARVTQGLADYIFVDALINVTGQSASFVNVARTNDPRPQALATAGEHLLKEGNSSLHFAIGQESVVASFEDSSGNVLAQHPLLNLGNYGPHELEGEPAIFSASELLPFPEGTTMIRLRAGDRILDERAVSPNPPEVTLRSPNGSEGDIATFIDFEWDARDTDGDPLSFMIQYSADGGQTWRAIATNVRGDSYTLDSLAYLPGSDNGKFRVVANDGVNSTADASDAALTIPNTAPAVAIYSPASGAIFARGASVVLLASATDWEDGLLSGAALHWESSLDGPLGDGEELQTRDLSPGQHRVKLTATDSAGATSEHEITVTIDDSEQRELPTEDELSRLEDILQARDGDGISTILTVAVAVAGTLLVAGVALVIVVRGKRSHPQG